MVVVEQLAEGSFQHQRAWVQIQPSEFFMKNNHLMKTLKKRRKWRQIGRPGMAHLNTLKIFNGLCYFPIWNLLTFILSIVKSPDLVGMEREVTSSKPITGNQLIIVHIFCKKCFVVSNDQNKLKRGHGWPFKIQFEFILCSNSTFLDFIGHSRPLFCYFSAKS